MDDSNLAKVIIQSKVDKVGNLRWSLNFPYFSHNTPSRILEDAATMQNSAQSASRRTSTFSAVIDKVFENISLIGVVYIIAGALMFFLFVTFLWYYYWYKYLRPYDQYKKVSTEYDELLSEVFAHDDLTDYEGGSSDGSIDSNSDSSNEGTKLEMRTLPSASKDVRLSLSEING